MKLPWGHVGCGTCPPPMIGDTASLRYLKTLPEFLLAVDEKVDTGDETGGDVVGFGADVCDDLIAREGLEGYGGDLEGDCFEEWVDLLDWLGGVICFVGGAVEGGGGGSGGYG